MNPLVVQANLGGPTYINIMPLIYSKHSIQIFRQRFMKNFIASVANYF